MAKSNRLSAQTRKNWLVDAAVFAGAAAASVSGIYFLFVTSGGYQGGRNPFYGVQVIFNYATWNDLHTWGGVLMIAAVAVHFVMHWNWVKMMARRTWAVCRQCGGMSKGAYINVAIDAVIAISFLLAAVSGLYFLFSTGGGYEGGRNPAWDASRAVWDVIHTWSGVVMIVAAVLHFYIHWRWVKNVTVKFFRSLFPEKPDRAVKVEVK
ncbi:MAG: DUF4405 domain-containing protein [Anaerolineae bacterium]|nr:DUF4405 domain-containing protein [Anaerolineae bacterium]